MRAVLRIKERHTAGLSADQARAIRNIAESPWLVQPLAAPAGAGKTTSLRALRATARDFYNRRVLVLAPTGQAVDVAVREGAGDTGMTIAKALKDLRESRLRLHPNTLVIVDEAAMVGTSELRELLAATTAAGVKTVLVGDAHQLAPVKARGGMFAQFCADLPWAQQLCEVWRMRDPEERSASLALRDGGPAPRRRAIDWYRTHGRLHRGDPVTMAHDAVNAYAADINAGKDALLVCDTTEMCDALNRRIHDAKVHADAPTVTAARGQRIAVGDLIISRRNDATMRIYQAEHDVPAADPVRNGNRWRVAAVDADRNRIAARRLSDGARAVFDGDYVREHITHGYAVTVHAAQGVTADTSPRRAGRKSDPRSAVRGDDAWPRVQQCLPVPARGRGVRIQRRRPRRAARAAPRQQPRRRPALRANHRHRCARTDRTRTRRRNRSRTPTNARGSPAHRPPHPHCADAASRLPPVVLKGPAAVGRSPTQHRPTPTPIA